MRDHLRPAIVLLLAFTLITGMLYPLAVTGTAQLLFPAAANGSVIQRNGNAVGSKLIGQAFSSPRYFWSRLSATTPFPYNAASSSGSNFGPMSEALRAAVKGRIVELQHADSTQAQRVPVDLVTASASGLDPHISIAAALYQVPRVARARAMTEAALRALIDRHTEHRDLGFLGESGVNVLELNLALDETLPVSTGGM